MLLRPLLQRFLKGPHSYSWPIDGHEVWSMTAGAIIHRLLEIWPER